MPILVKLRLLRYTEVMNIAIIGKKFKGLSDFLADNGHSYRIFLDTHQNSGKKAKENCVLIDFEDSTNVIETISGVHAKTPFDAVLTIYEKYIVITS